ncbi:MULTISPECIES: immune inhibitor A domain-containing protein [Streptosporangium]|uniref:Immune inhibitor A n=1 Tax=Streptosporangium brasiliense TaxID=47480 RepID=A0ABT9QW08_9ACTN|nr:immune inhibitor A domain-containing protein [Streptosporangium brasiliense]MDP9861153.1 immune inhibitor A [Streptosporangium brasiliense]
MRKLITMLAAGLVGTALGASALPGLAAADPDPAPKLPAAKPGDGRHSDAVSPFAVEEQSLRTKAMEQALTAPQAGKRSSGKVKVGDRYVELALERKDKIFTVLAEFGNKIDNTTLHGGKIRYGGVPGPLHNQIPRPQRGYDNHTLWQRDFSRAYYQDIYFNGAQGANSLRNFYRLQSAGRYDFDGYVSDWVKVPYNESRYGTPRCDSGLDCDTPLFDFVKDSANAWYDAERAKGRSVEDITAELKSYDVWDRYDHDFDGDFDEPDGYIDRFQVIHAGVDETWGGGAQGADALWAVNHDAYWNLRGSSGPAGNLRGGTQIGDTGVWVGKFLTAGENSGVGLIAHEYGHDLGLPDLYDGGGSNSVQFWSLMSSASYLSRKDGPSGEYPGDLDAWSKLRLGWLSHDRAKAATASTHTLGVSSYNTADPQAVIVDLPPHTVTTELVEPAQGSHQWWSGRGDYLNETLSREIDLTGAAPAVLNAKVWYQIEQDFDYLYAEVSEDGKVWTPIGGTVGGQPIPSVNGVPGITGRSGWTDLSLPLDAYRGKKIQFRFRYFTDTNTAENGFIVDAVTGAVTDDAENGDNGWSAAGFSRVGKTGTKQHPRAYIAENRRYTGYGAYLKTGPYSAGFSNDPTRREIYEHYSYREGVLVWLWDTYYTDNATRNHPGEGMILPIDAHPVPLLWKDNSMVNDRLQGFDAPFGLSSTGRFALHKDSAKTTFPSLPAVPAFNDRTGVYWYSTSPLLGVRPPDTNTEIKVVREAAKGLRTTITVGPAS